MRDRGLSNAGGPAEAARERDVDSFSLERPGDRGRLSGSSWSESNVEKRAGMATCEAFAESV